MSRFWLLDAVDVIFIVGTLLFFFGFFTIQSASLYPFALFLISIFFIRVFRGKISHFEISKNGLAIKFKEAEERRYEKDESLKARWNYFVEEKEYVR